MSSEEDKTRPQAPTQATVVGPSEQPTHQEAGESLEDRIKRKLTGYDEGSETTEERVDPLIGQTINGRFKIIKKIGAGGMGAVYRAQQVGINRDVAVKVLLRDLTDNATVVRRFHLEALAVSKLKHPNTIQIFDFGETPDGLLYIAMEFLEGRPLSEVLREERQVSVRRALHLIGQAASSLREAHAKGIVHRDLKPDNIFLQPTGDDQDFVKVLDFGVAKVAGGDGQEKTLTKAGAIFGTPKYMSPEQARGAETDERSDIYALGVILFELLSGRVPFNAENPLGILVKHIQERPPSFESVRPELVIPEAVERFVLRLLAKPREERPQTAEAVAQECQKLLAALPPIFRKVVTRSDVAAAGIEVATLSQTALDTELGLGGADQTLTTALAPRTRRWPLIIALAVVIATLGTGGVLYASLAPLDKNYYHFTTLATADVQLVPEFDVDSVVVSLLSDPEGVRVENARGETIGTTRFMMRRNKNAPAEQVTLKHEGYHDVVRTIDFSKDDAVLIKLEPLARPTTPTVKPREPVTSPLGGEPTPNPHPTTPPTPTTQPKVQEPVIAKDPPKRDPWDGPTKVDELKTNPYGTKKAKTPESEAAPY